MHLAKVRPRGSGLPRGRGVSRGRRGPRAGGLRAWVPETVVRVATYLLYDDLIGLAKIFDLTGFQQQFFLTTIYALPNSRM